MARVSRACTSGSAITRIARRSTFILTVVVVRNRLPELLPTALAFGNPHRPRAGSVHRSYAPVSKPSTTLSAATNRSPNLASPRPLPMRSSSFSPPSAARTSWT